MDEVGSCRCVRSAVSGFQNNSEYSLINCDVIAKMKSEEREHRGMRNCLCMNVQSSIQRDENKSFCTLSLEY